MSELPKGKYTMVSVDVDTTGRRLIDEIVQLSAYTPESQFAEYIMPIMNLNPAARQRHQIRVITVGFFRMLKSMQTYKVVKTKPEIAVLKDFLDWLETLRKNDPESKGIILIHHEQRKFVPYMLLEALQKYDLVDRFMKSVKSFADGFALSVEKCGNPVKYFSILQTADILKLNYKDAKENQDFDGCARIRTKLAYQIIEQIAKGDESDLDAEATAKKMHDLVFQRASSIKSHFSSLDDQNKCMERQNSMRPIFVNYFKVTLYHRVRGVTFRRVLADHGYDFESLKDVWESKKKEGLVELVNTISDLKEEDQKELIDILDCHFDPDKKPILPNIKRNNRPNNRRQSISQKENVRPRNQRDDGVKKGGNDANNKNAGNRRQNRRTRRRSYNSATRPAKGDDMKQRNGGNMAPNMVAAAN
ncbi:maternal protein exuperantia [Bradysia coprophila]|uniref:maternal protein exuperantia n=1 Tax=Bradysia coprophila TaxID=38358 RepID=UPI00187DCB82|nr:maternal protein exuperantia [Bradysia coprophila]